MCSCYSGYTLDADNHTCNGKGKYNDILVKTKWLQMEYRISKFCHEFVLQVMHACITVRHALPSDQRLDK